jgi:hypothetical protein
MRFPGNVETRNILVGGVNCLHVHSHGSKGHVVERNIGSIGNILYGGCTGVRVCADSCGIFAQPKKVYVVASVQSSDVDIRSIRAIHGTVVRFPGNVETRNILVGVDRLHVHSHGSKDTSLSEMGESGYSVRWLASTEFAFAGLYLCGLRPIRGVVVSSVVCVRNA